MVPSLGHTFRVTWGAIKNPNAWLRPCLITSESLPMGPRHQYAVRGHQVILMSGQPVLLSMVPGPVASASLGACWTCGISGPRQNT